MTALDRTTATGMAAWARDEGLDAIARPAKYAEAWVVEINGRAYGSIYHIRQAVAALKVGGKG